MTQLAGRRIAAIACGLVLAVAIASPIDARGLIPCPQTAVVRGTWYVVDDTATRTPQRCHRFIRGD